MAISVFDLFKIGIGPSSSHTVGPMRAAGKFVHALQQQGKLQQVRSIKVELFGSLGATGLGHGTDKAILLGLEGEIPELVDTTLIDQRLASIRSSKTLNLLQQHSIHFSEPEDFILHRKKCLAYHSNGMQINAFDENGIELYGNTYYSVGGGFVVEEQDAKKDVIHASDDTVLPFSFKSMAELLKFCQLSKMSISQIMMENEKCWRSEGEIREGLLKIWQVMQDCIQAGFKNDGILPGGLNVKRRAPTLYKKLCNQQEEALRDPLTTMD